LYAPGERGEVGRMAGEVRGEGIPPTPPAPLLAASPAVSAEYGLVVGEGESVRDDAEGVLRW